MVMSPRLRRFALTAHVMSTVGWLGAVVVFLALAVIGLSSQDAQTVRGTYLVMDPTARLVLVPLAFASLLTGLVQSLGTVWGLFRHYWVLCKLLLTVAATIVLLTYMETFEAMAEVAADPTADLGAVHEDQTDPACPYRPEGEGTRRQLHFVDLTCVSSCRSVIRTSR